jgi:hypothetical protein
LSTVYGKHGKPDLLRRLSGYNRAAEHLPWVVMVDLDSDEPCAPPFVAAHLPVPAPWMCLRVVVRTVGGATLHGEPDRARRHEVAARGGSYAQRQPALLQGTARPACRASFPGVGVSTRGDQRELQPGRAAGASRGTGVIRAPKPRNSAPSRDGCCFWRASGLLARSRVAWQDR